MNGLELSLYVTIPLLRIPFINSTSCVYLLVFLILPFYYTENNQVSTFGRGSTNVIDTVIHPPS